MMSINRIINLNVFTLTQSVIKRFLNIGHLNTRGFISLKGSKSSEFLQGLITNDTHLIDKPNSFIYTLFLNSKGRILNDAFIYHCAKHESEFLIESDKSTLEQLATHLKFYNLRKKVNITVDDSINLWIAMSENSQLKEANDLQVWFPTNLFKNFDMKSMIFYGLDPRAIIGWSGRILIRRTECSTTKLFSDSRCEPLDLMLYHCLRWKLGLPEGMSELISNESLPFDANADLTGGVSFAKGCYIGQELTARSYFTGIIRRRYIPIKLKFCRTDRKTIAIGHFCNAPIYQLDQNSNKLGTRPVGWIRGLYPSGNETFEGIALLRLTEAEQEHVKMVTRCEELSDDYLEIFPFLPSWWPSEVWPKIRRLDDS